MDARVGAAVAAAAEEEATPRAVVKWRTGGRGRRGERRRRAHLSAHGSVVRPVEPHVGRTAGVARCPYKFFRGREELHLDFDVEELHLDFLLQAFPYSLVALLVTTTLKSKGGEIDIKSVQFKDGAAPKLEMLKFGHCGYCDDEGIVNAGLFSGLASLSSLRKFELTNSSFKGSEAFVEDVQTQLAQNPNRPVLIKW
jgi:hypothetical protein